MISTTNNIFDLSNIKDFSHEVFEILAQNNKVRIERIISTGQTTPEVEWFDSEFDEWVILLEGNAEILFEDGEVKRFSKGDYYGISANRKHKVTYTSSNPPCIWFAVYF